MKLLAYILVTLLSVAAYAQPTDLRVAVEKLDKAMVEKDSVALKQLAHPGLNYGHSNGWVQLKHEFIADMYNGKITYTKIESRDFIWSTYSPTLATVRSTANIEYVLDGKQGKLTLHVLQVWRKTLQGWQLVARQSTKLEDKH